MPKTIPCWGCKGPGCEICHGSGVLSVYTQKEFDIVVKKFKTAYENYIELLEQELGNLAALAHTHGWKSSLIEEGKKARKIIEALKGSD